MDVSSFSLRAPEGQQIIGLFGARGGNQGLLIRVGAYVAPAPSPKRPSGVSPEAPDYVVAWASMTSGIQDYARWQEMFEGRSGKDDPPFRRGRIWA